MTVPAAPLKPWMTGELVQQTRSVWSPRYGRQLSDGEAMEILENTKRLAEALLRIHQERQSV